MHDLEFYKKLTPVISSKYYSEAAEVLKKILKLTRDKAKVYDPYGLYRLQELLVNFLISIEDDIKMAKRSKDEFSLQVNLHIDRMVRNITDGIAWRILDFDRPFIRIMTEPNKRLLSVNISSDIVGPLKNARSISSKGKYALLCDITNCLRVGDVIEVSPHKKTIIHEIKKKGEKILNIYTETYKKKKDPNYKIGHQFKNIFPTQHARDFRTIKVQHPNDITESITILDINIPISTNFVSLNSVINRARRKGYGSKTIGKYLHISAVNINTLKNKYPALNSNQIKIFNIEHPSKWNNTLSFSSYDTFEYNLDGLYMKNVAPFSIFDCSNTNVMSLISGETILTTTVNLDEIKTIFEESNWDVSQSEVKKTDNLKVINKLKTATTYKYSIYQYGIEESFYEIEKNGLRMSIPMSWIMYVLIEMISPYTLVDICEWILVSEKYDTEGVVAFNLSQYRSVFK